MPFKSMRVSPEGIIRLTRADTTSFPPVCGSSACLAKGCKRALGEGQLSLSTRRHRRRITPTTPSLAYTCVCARARVDLCHTSFHHPRLIVVRVCVCSTSVRHCLSLSVMHFPLGDVVHSFVCP